MTGCEITRPNLAAAAIILAFCKTMKTTVDLPDELMRTVKIRAVRENRKLRDMIAELLRRGLGETSDSHATARARVQLPLVRCAHPAHPAEEMTPERVADSLLAEEASWVRR